MTKHAARIIIFFIWAISIACSAPYGYYHRTQLIPPYPASNSTNSSSLMELSGITDNSTLGGNFTENSTRRFRLEQQLMCLPLYGEDGWWKGMLTFQALTVSSITLAAVISQDSSTTH